MELSPVVVSVFVEQTVEYSAFPERVPWLLSLPSHCQPPHYLAVELNLPDGIG